jgi:dihydroneopterin aldolase
MQHTVKIDGYRTRAFVGIYEEEQTLGNEIEVDLAITVDIDNHNKIVDYEKAGLIIKEILDGKHEYLEDVNALIIQELKSHFPQAEKIVLATYKLHPTFMRGAGKAGVKSVWMRG